MFKRENRLIPGIRFNNSYLSTNPQFILKEKGNGLTVNRFGIIVSKKIDKRAVARNKIKRMFRDILSKLSKNMTLGHDILVITKIGVLEKAKEENYSIVKSELTKAGLMKDE